MPLTGNMPENSKHFLQTTNILKSNKISFHKKNIKIFLKKKPTLKHHSVKKILLNYRLTHLDTLELRFHSRNERESGKIFKTTQWGVIPNSQQS